MQYTIDIDDLRLEIRIPICCAEFTAAAVSHHFDRHIRPHFEESPGTFDLFVCGGGVKNKSMMR